MGRPRKSAAPADTPPVRSPSPPPAPEVKKRGRRSAAASAEPPAEPPAARSPSPTPAASVPKKKGRLASAPAEPPPTRSPSPAAPEPKRRGRKSAPAAPPPPTSTAKKRGRKSAAVLALEEPVKKLKLGFRHDRGHGQVLTVGQGDTGQLGLGEDVMEKTRPGLVDKIKNAVDAVAGGMHTAVLDLKGKVWTFGCNDEGSLGREVAEEEECFVPGVVGLEGKVVMLSAGDSHTAALTEEGNVWAWGTFRDSSGPIGLVDVMKIEMFPVRVLEGVEVTKICSGSDHLVMLGRKGQVWTMGNGEQGQLGRVGEMFAHRGGRRGIKALLKPEQVRVKTRMGGFRNVWAGSYNTVARTGSDEVVVMGLNNYTQMAIPLVKGLTFYMPEVSEGLTKEWDEVAMGQHHAVCLEQGGLVFSLGRQEYGRLGLGEGGTDATSPVAVSELQDCVAVACGTAVSYAVTAGGDCYSWGMGTNGQLGTGGEDDSHVPVKMGGELLQGKKVIAVSSGGQHTVLIAQ
eukprot:GFUD01040278.1.p1 GENE.GFUD01040278.1~~GFUD01040278.1.p1  ORF type:complete len:513 (-),score=145.40 GFUD01040278.1:94-1632(-)